MQTFGYDAANRLTNTASWAGSFGYAYHPGLGSLTTASRLTRKLSLPTGGYVTNIFDPLGRLTETTLNNAAHNALNLHGYGYNLGKQRTNQTFLDGNKMAYTYDALGQLKTAKGTDPTSPTTRRHEQFTYSYDSSGNLEKRISNQLTNTFKVNRLNQLTNAARSGTITAAGISDGATNVTVNGSSAERYDDGTFARTNLTLNTGNTTFTAIASDASGRSATNQVTVTMPPSVNFTNDAKGNLTADGRRTFVYDDENQLIQVTIAGSTQSKFAYDGLGRRRIRTELLWQGGAWVTNSVTRYVYAGLLVVQERDGNNVPVVAYTRGLDLSGTLQGAGGIGGLLARTDQKQQPHAHAFYHADGSGNVTALMDENERLAARYSYDPFGNVLAMDGPLAEANLYRFSSKEAHPVSGLVYYGYRFYDPNLQRWLNRDPIEEAGGVNLYGFVFNDPVNWIDPFGLQRSRAPIPPPRRFGNPRSVRPIGAPMWSGSNMTEQFKRINEHWRKHKQQFPELRSKKEYVKKAQRTLAEPPQHCLVGKRGSDTGVFDPKTGTLTIGDQLGAPRTMFKPAPKSPSNPSGYDPKRYCSPEDYFRQNFPNDIPAPSVPPPPTPPVLPLP